MSVNARLKATVASIGDSVKQCKITLLQRLVYGGDFDLVCVMETWLDSFISRQ